MTVSAQVRSEMETLWSQAKIQQDQRGIVRSSGDFILTNRSTFEKVAEQVGCPWCFVGILSVMEAGHRFTRWLANGDPLTGKTVLVPAGLTVPGKNPPYDWAEAAIVSLKYDKKHEIASWDIPTMLWEFETWNGLGYRNRGHKSQYVWASTQFEEPGRYVQDGVWSETALSDQPGCAALLLYLKEKGVDILAIPGKTTTPAEPSLVPTWMEAFRETDGSFTIIGWDGHQEKEAVRLERCAVGSEIAKFLQKHDATAKTILLAPAGKAIPEKVTEPVPPPPPPPQPTGPAHMRITRTGRSNSKGLEVLKLEMVNGAGEFWLCHSGAPGRQVFQRGGSNNVPGSLYPCPQGEYSIENIMWAGGSDNYNATHGPGLGPVFVPFEPKFSTRRGSFGYHLDENAATSPGSAGCIVVDNIEELKRLVAALRKWDPKRLVVEWGV